MFRWLLEAGYKTVRRVVIGVVGTTIVLVGIALIFLPGPALVVIPAGLGILSLEFAFARRWLKLAREHAGNAMNGVLGNNAKKGNRARGEADCGRGNVGGGPRDGDRR